jgi:site-specific DNA recombinase
VQIVYEEQARSGRNTDRAEYQRMLADAERGLFDVVIVHKLDRFGRKLKDILTHIESLERCRVSFVSVVDQFDMSTPGGRLQLGIMGSVVQWYADNLGTETKKGQQERSRQGGWLGTLSYGYTTPRRLKERLGGNVGPEVEAIIKDTLEKFADAEETQAIPDPFDSGVVQLIFEMYSTGTYSYKGIADRLNADGYRINSRFNSDLFRRDNIRGILINRFYVGDIPVTDGKKGRASIAARTWKTGAHQPLIERGLFDKVQDVVTRRNAYAFPREKKYDYIWSGLLVDETGIQWIGSKRSSGYSYRRSTHQLEARGADDLAGAQSINADIVDRQMLAILRQMMIPPEMKETILKEFRPVSKPSKAKPDKDVRLARLADLYIDGNLSKAEYTSRKAAIEAESEPVQPEYTFDEIESVLDVLVNIDDVWHLANAKERIELAKMLFKRLEVRPVGKKVQVAVVYLTPLAGIFIDHFTKVVYSSGGGGLYPRILYSRHRRDVA